MKLLITGFEPFGGEAVNPSWEAVKMLPDRIEAADGKEIEVVKRTMPVAFDRCGEIAEHYIEEIMPDCVICVGQAGGRTAITPEQIAINMMDSVNPDNDGVIHRADPVIAGGPDGRFTKLPIRRMVEACKAAEIPAYVSFSAGSYVCNCLMYHVMDIIENQYPEMTGGFIHVPYACGQAAAQNRVQPSLPLSVIAAGLEACIRAL